MGQEVTYRRYGRRALEWQGLGWRVMLYLRLENWRLFIDTTEADAFDGVTWHVGPLYWERIVPRPERAVARRIVRELLDDVERRARG